MVRDSDSCYGSRRVFLLPFLALLIVLVTGCDRSVHEPAPNVLLISLDTLRADHLGSYGYHRDTSPFLDEFASSGVRFESAFVNTHSTAPSHATLLSSRYQETHGVHLDLFAMARHENDPSMLHFPPDLPMVQELMAGAGYRTCAITGGGYVSAEMGFQRGFDHYDDTSRDVRSGAAKLLEWLRNNPGEAPKFVFFHTYQVHGPYLSPPEYQEMFGPAGAPPEAGPDPVQTVRRTIAENILHADRISPGMLEYLRNRYDRSLRYTDDTLRDLFAELRTTGFLDNALVVIISDHGEEFGEHGRLQHTDTLFEELVHIPLLVAGPGVEGGRVSRRMASTIDIAPTILSYCGVEVPEDFEGADLLSGDEDADAKVFFQRGNFAYGVRTRRWKFVIGAQPQALTPANPVSLYDIEADPGEQHNLAAEMPGNVRLYRREIERWKKPLKAERASRRLAHTPRRPASAAQLKRLKSLGYIR